LTGQPPYAGGDTAVVLARAARADLAGAYGRLDGCVGPPELVALAKQCLAAEPEARPRGGGAVAGAVARHLARAAERPRAADLAGSGFASPQARDGAGRALAEAQADLAAAEADRALLDALLDAGLPRESPRPSADHPGLAGAIVPDPDARYAEAFRAAGV